MQQLGADIDSEAKQNTVESRADLTTNHCVVIMEQMPMELEAPAPRWRVAATLLVKDAEAGLGLGLDVDLPFVLLPALVHKRQVVAVAKYPAVVSKWTFRFESDDGRAKARVWLQPGSSLRADCGIFIVRGHRGADG